MPRPSPHPPRQGLAWTLVSLLLAGGCAIDTAALGGGPADGSPDGGPRDGRLPDGPLPDGDLPDAGPGCAAFDVPRVVAVLDGDDFAHADATLSDVVVEAPGQLALALSPWRYGGLLATGFDAPLLGVTPSFDDLSAGTVTARAILERLETSFSGGEGPPSLLLASDDSYSVLAEGQIFLTSGSHEVRLRGDDRALVEISGSGSGAVSVVADGSGTATVSFVVPSNGWYPIRIAWSNVAGSSGIEVELRLPDSSTEIVGGARLRADLSDVPGRDMLGWDSRTADETPDGERIDPGGTVNEWAGSDFPRGLGIADDADFTVRWFGRHLLSEGGRGFRAEADDRFRLWVDGVFLGTGSAETFPAGLPPGWHDVVLDLEQGGGGRYARLLYDGVPFAPSELRPRTRFGAVPFGTGWDGPTNVDGGRATAQTLTVVAPEGPLAAVEISAVVRIEDPSMLSLGVTAPTGVSFAFTLATRARPAGPGLWQFRAVVGPSALSTAAGSWTVELRNPGSVRAVWESAGVLAHVLGDEAPFAAAGTFTSAVIDLGVETDVRRVLHVADLPTDTGVQLAAKAGATAAAAAAASPVPVRANGEVGSPVRGRFLQVVATLTGGVDTPRVEDIRVVGAPCTVCDPAIEVCPTRAHAGLVALYTFEEGRGTRVRDLSGFERPLDLFVADPSAVTWSAEGLSVTASTRILSAGTARKVQAACQSANELTVEAWLRPANVTQAGPARVVTMSPHKDLRNFMLGQDGSAWVLRHRTTDTDGNGGPDLDGPGMVATEWQHVVFAHDDGGMARMWIDGVHQRTWERTGDYSTWEDYPLGLANELGDERRWLGDLGRVAVYCRALTPAEVGRHFDAGRE